MEGEWIVRNRDNYSIPFVARHGQDHRFTTLRKEPKLDLTGKWETTFEIGTEDEYKAIGEFQQNGNKLTGTFLTETGDYRFLEGTVQENKMYLSVFDGSHAFLFEAKITEEETLIGSFRSGTHYRTTWEAKRNPDFKLKDEGELTFLNEGYDKVNFSFPNTKGEMVSLDDDRYQGKVKIVNIFGTWCPNCRDEAKFLKEYLDTHPNNDLEVISLAFEKRKTEEEAFAAIERFRTNLGVNYEILYAGYYNKKQAAEALPMLNHILSYPTMIIIDKNDQVRRIHTGFSGPATSKYATFKEEFDTLVQEILREPI
jgi:thiol-disulfide isomerase/thioredoxin